MENLAKLLKNVPAGTQLYSPIFGNVYLNKIVEDIGIHVNIYRPNSSVIEAFMYDGKYDICGECMLFPSKENRDWENFNK